MKIDLKSIIDPRIIEGDMALNKALKLVNRHCIVSKEAAIAMVLWATYTHGYNWFEYSPLLALNSPTKRCGKTRSLAVLMALSHNGKMVNYATKASIYRISNIGDFTVGFDEADQTIALDRSYLPILNGGHLRYSSSSILCDGEENKVSEMNAFYPKAMALIGTFPDTLRDRSILLPLQRKRPEQEVESLSKNAEEFEQRKSALAAWMESVKQDLQEMDLPRLKDLHDRANDSWGPLLGIAKMAGGDWYQKAVNAAHVIERFSPHDDSNDNERILRAIFYVLKEVQSERISTKDLITLITSDEESPYSDEGERKLTPSKLAWLLKPFGISPKTLRIDRDPIKGYEVKAFQDAFERYLD